MKENRQFCEWCGTKLAADAQFCPVCRPAQETVGPALKISAPMQPLRNTRSAGHDLARRPLRGVNLKPLVRMMPAFAIVMAVLAMIVLNAPHPPTAAAQSNLDSMRQHEQENIKLSPMWTIVQPITMSAGADGNYVYSNVWKDNSGKIHHLEMDSLEFFNNEHDAADRYYWLGFIKLSSGCSPYVEFGNDSMVGKWVYGVYITSEWTCKPDYKLYMGQCSSPDQYVVMERTSSSLPSA